MVVQKIVDFIDRGETILKVRQLFRKNLKSVNDIESLVAVETFYPVDCWLVVIGIILHVQID